MKKVGFRCSAPYSTSKNDIVEEVTSFILSLDTSERRENIMVNNTGDTIESSLFFVDTPVRFYLTDKTVTIDVDSTMTGPGYHATMVNMMRYMGEATSLRWDWSTLTDDTGYCQHGDFGKLQEYMRDWLREYSRELINSPNISQPVYINLITPYAMLPTGDDYFACHILGHIHKDFFIYINEYSEPFDFCRAFFVWWNMELDAEFYLKCALSLIWCRLNWLPPVQEDEVRYVNNVLQELETAWRMDKTLQLPVPEWIELAKLLRDQELADELIRRFPTQINQPPAKGYRRHDILQILGEKKWTIRLPGKMHQALDEDGSLMFWDHDDRSIRILSSSHVDNNGVPVPATLLSQQSLLGEKAKPFLLHADLSIPALILHEDTSQGGKTMYCTTLFAAMDGSSITISLHYAEMAQKAWAISVCNSLTPTV